METEPQTSAQTPMDYDPKFWVPPVPIRLETRVGLECGDHRGAQVHVAGGRARFLIFVDEERAKSLPAQCATAKDFEAGAEVTGVRLSNGPTIPGAESFFRLGNFVTALPSSNVPAEAYEGDLTLCAFRACDASLGEEERAASVALAEALLGRRTLLVECVLGGDGNTVFVETRAEAAWK